MSIKKFIRKLIYPNKHNSDAYVTYLKSVGCKIGENTYFYDPLTTLIDSSRPEFIEIGANCQITKGVTILAHDYSYSVLRDVYKEMLPTSGVTKIGNNVFIGMNSTILMNTTIEDNVIIGAGSVVRGTIKRGTIVAGNPAKPISTIDNMYKKLKDNVLENAKVHAKHIQKVKGRNPNIKEMGYYSWIFTDTSSENVDFSHLPFFGHEKEAAISDYLKQNNIYNSFEEFLKDLQ
ncbi:acyltransferase [Niallia taxi]|uniref:acyltransferase n=1 Tax=Niallia taxi TaxID=2499688 RepID=UPI0021A63107|nr:acyltransferase [Niallia taxi]MCT2347451.1 acyltransferase [Niallia taxi]